jgi:hypothetical protein
VFPVRCELRYFLYGFSLLDTSNGIKLFGWGQVECGYKCKVLDLVPGQEADGSPRVTPQALELSFAVMEPQPETLVCTQAEFTAEGCY